MRNRPLFLTNCYWLLHETARWAVVPSAEVCPSISEALRTTWADETEISGMGKVPALWTWVLILPGPCYSGG